MTTRSEARDLVEYNTPSRVSNQSQESVSQGIEPETHKTKSGLLSVQRQGISRTMIGQRATPQGGIQPQQGV